MRRHERVTKRVTLIHSPRGPALSPCDVDLGNSTYPVFFSHCVATRERKSEPQELGEPESRELAARKVGGIESSRYRHTRQRLRNNFRR